MGKKLLIVASKRYGDYVKEIAESMGCFEAISFVDNDREGAIGKLEEVETFYPEYSCAIAACDDGAERLEWNKKLEALYNIPVLFHMDSTISPSANLMPGCIVEPRAVVGCGSTCFLASNFPHFHRYDSLKSALYIHAVSKNINTFPKNQGRIRAAIAVKILDFTVMYR